MSSKTRIIRIDGLFRFLVGLTTLFSVDQWSKINIAPPIFVWSVFTLTYYCVFRIGKSEFAKDLNTKDNGRFLIFIYIWWVLFAVMRGLFVSTYYWDYKELIQNTAILLFPAFIFVFYNPINTSKLLFFWLKFILPLFFIYIFFIESAVYSRFISPMLLLGCCIPALTRKWRVITIFFLVLLLFADFTARSQMIESFICIVLTVMYPIIKRIHPLVITLVHRVLFLLPGVLLVLGLSGVFNVLAMDEYLNDVEVTGKSGETESLIADSRSFIYAEIVESAMNNGYVLAGRTPARGYDSMQFGSDEKVYKDTGRYERAASEMLHPNIFTWLGVVGVILYGAIYFYASSKAVDKSNNCFLKLLGLYVAFRWMYGWIEDFGRWDIMNITLWMMIAICYSPYFRKMTDIEFKNWIRECLPL